MDEDNQRLLAELQEQNAKLKQQVAALRSSHVLLQAVVEGTTDAVFVKDLQGRYLLANAATTGFVGKPVEEILGRDDTVLFSAETALQIMERDRRILKSGQTQTDEEVGTAAGQTRTYLATKGPCRDDQGCVIGLFGISRDITEHKRLDTELLERESHLRAILDTEPECVKLLGPNCALLQMNPAGLRMIEADSLDQVVGQSVLGLVLPEYRPAFAELTERVLRGATETLVFEIQGLRGTRLWLETHATPYRDAAGQITSLLGITRDITEHKRAERALRASEERFSKAFRSSPDAMSLIGLPEGRVIDVNDRFIELTGHSREDVIGRTTLELGFWDDPALRDRFYKMLHEQGAVSGLDVTLLTKSGELCEVQLSSVLFELDGRSCMMTSSRNVTAQKRAEQALHASEQRFRALIEHSFDAIALVGQDGKLLYGSPAATRITGRTADEWIGQGAFERIHPDDVPLARDIFAKLLENPTVPQQSRFRYLHKDESWIWLEITATNLLKQPAVQAIVVNYRDITERMRAEKLVEMHRAELQLIFDSVPAMIFYKDIHGRLLRMNDEVARKIGLPKADLLGKTAAELGSPYAEQYLAQERQVVSTGQPVRNIIEKMHTARGDRWMQTDKIPHRDADGRIIGIIGFAVDITESKQAAETLRASEERFSKVFQNSPDSIALVSCPDGRLIDVNDHFVEFTGHSREDAIGHTSLELGLWDHPADRDWFVHMSSEPKGMQAFEASLRTKSGERRDMQFSSDMIHLGDHHCLIAVGRDVTAQNQVEYALRESQARLQMVMQAGDVGLWDWNLLTNETIYSTEWKRQLGYADSEILCRFEEWESRLHPDDRGRTLAAVSDFHEGRRPDYDVEFRLRHKDGSWRWILARADMIRDTDGKPVRMMGCHVDITDRKRAETALREREQQLGLFVEHSPAAIAMMDRDLRYLVASQRWLSDYRLGAESIIGLCHYDLFPEISERWKEIHRRCLAGAIEKCDEDALLRADGTTDWIRWEIRPWHTVQGDVGGLLIFSEVITERKQAEAALRASEQRFATVFRASPVGICVTRLADGTFFDMNDAFLRIIGHTREQMIGRSSLALNYWLDPEDRPKVVHALQATGSVRNWEMRFLRRDGSVRDSIRSLERITLGDEDCILTILDDITERKQAEESLAIERQLLRTMADNLPAYVFVKDAAGRYLFVNRTHAHQLGLKSEAAMLGKTVFDIFPAHIARSFDADDQTVIQTGQPVIEREERFEVSGDLGWFLTTKVPLRDAEGAITGLVGIALDITARKQAEAALVEERNLLRTLVDHIPDFIFVKDTESRQLLNNAANLCLIGVRTDAEMVGKTVFDLYPREQAQRYYDEDQRVMRSGQAQLNQEESLLDQDGQERWLLSSKVPLRDVHGKCIGLVGIKRDITAQRRVSLELVASRERLEILSRQLIETQESERRHLARELHDEIGQSLTGIKLNLKALQQPARESISTTLVAETIAVVDQVLQQVRSLALDLRPSMLDDIGLVAATRWCLDRQSRLAGFVATFVADAADGHVSPNVTIACFRVVQEALTNIARHAHARNVRVELHHRESELKLLVQDDGCGFDVAAARDRAVRGGSLGLLGMEERAQLVGGQIEMTSTPARGTTIHARFPLTTGSS